MTIPQKNLMFVFKARCSVGLHYNGCGLKSFQKFKINLLYKERLVDACNKHDVCYNCVSKVNVLPGSKVSFSQSSQSYMQCKTQNVSFAVIVKKKNSNFPWNHT